MTSLKGKLIQGVWAEEALTTIPPTPVQGTGYRDDALVTNATQRAGQGFDSLVESARWNAMLRFIHLLGEELETRGIVGYSDSVDFKLGAIAIGSDNLPHRAIAINGPATVVSDPVDGPDASTYWEPWPNLATVSRAGVVRQANVTEVAERQSVQAFVTPDALPLGATTVIRGTVELGTQQEINDGNAARVVTGETLGNRQATTTLNGLVELGTQQEINDGNAARVVTGETLSGRLNDLDTVDSVAYTITSHAVAGLTTATLTAPVGYRYIDALGNQIASISLAGVGGSGGTVTVVNNATSALTISAIWALNS